MNPSDELFLLIKSLTKSEKRDFKLYAKRYNYTETKVCIRIFDIINSVDVYNEAKVLRKLRDKKAVAIFPQMKVYLSNLIMRSLRTIDSRSSKVNNELQFIQDELIFHEKYLLDHRIKSIKKAKELTSTAQDYHILLLSIDRQGILEHEAINENFEEIFVKLENEELIILNNLTLETKLKHIYFKLWSQYLNNPNISNSKLKKYILDLRNHELLQSDSDLCTFKSKWFYLRSHAILCLFLNDKPGSLSYCEKIVTLFEGNPIQKENIFPSYQSALINFLAACHRVEKYEQFEEILGIIYSLPITSQNNDVVVFSNAGFYELLYLINTGQLDKVILIAPEIDLKLSKFKSQIQESRILSFYSNIAVTYFLAEQHFEAIDFTNKLRNYSSEIRIDIQHLASLLELIIHYEIGNNLLLKHKIRNHTRFLKQNDLSTEFDGVVCKHLKRLSNSHAFSNKKSLYVSFKNELESIKNDNPTIKFPLIDEILIYIKSKINNTTMQIELNIKIQERKLGSTLN